MRKFVILGVATALVFAVPTVQAKTEKPAPPSKSHKCKPHAAGYNASGTLIASDLTVSGNGRYSGTLEVQVNRVNHRGLAGDQTFTLTNARVVFHHGVNSADPAVGSKVKLHGKVTQLAKKCPTEGFSPTVTLRKVDIRQGKTS